MQLNHHQDCCDPQQLQAYLSDSLDGTTAVQVEEHLSSCHTCRERFDQFAFTQQEWQRTQSLLRPDDLDSALLELQSEHGHADRDSFHNESAMLSREIQGWLDPTDDPAMLGRFAGYEIVGIIGHGGMGIVLKGLESALNRYVAIKILAPRLATNGTARKRFAREARAAAAVLHENVIAIHRVDEWHGLPFLVMPYIAGVSLQKRIDDEGPLSIEAILRVGIQIAAGLAAAHAQGLVHRDIKPANILLDRGVERVTITDFGLARAADDASMTRTGVIAGTPQYMSPEQAEAKTMDARSDLFSLGSVMYTMAAGRPPFRGEGCFEVLNRIGTEAARPLREIDPTIPLWFENLVNLLHQKSALNRPKSASEVQHLLNACLLHFTQPNQELPHELVSSAASNGRRQLWLSAGIGILALAVIWPAFFLQPAQVDDTDGKQLAGSAPAAEDKGKQIATVLGKPIFEGDINKNVSDDDNLVHLLFEPLMEHYCQQQGIDRDAELKAEIKDEPSRAAARIFVMRAELNRHLYEKYGGRVQLTAFGPVAFDGQMKWIEERKKAGDFDIKDPGLQAAFDKLWVQEPKDAIFASPSQIKEAFDPAITERFIDNYAKIPSGAFMNPELKLIGVVAGSPVYLPKQAINDPDLPLTLHQLIVWPLEKHYLNKHPEVAPADAEIDAFTAQREKEDAETNADYQRGIDELTVQMENLKSNSEAILELQTQQRVLERKLNDSGGREAAATHAVPIKFQKHLYDNYGGGRGLMTPMGIDAFDAQRKWVEERERLGEFQIPDLKLREKFYEYWSDGKERFGVRFIDDLGQVKANFTLPWVATSPEVPAAVGQGDPDSPLGLNDVLSLNDINQSLAELPASMHHDFEKNGLPSDGFAVRGEDVSEQVIAKPDGLHVTHFGTDGYSNTFVETLNRIHGDFEVTVSFKDFTIEPGENGSGGISLTAILENAKHTHGTIHRGATVDYVNPIWNFVQSEFVHSPQRDPGVVWLGTTAEQATSGRIRLARVGETLYCLFAANDSPEFRLIHAEQVGPEDLLYGGVRLITQVQSNGSTRGTTSVIWKDITIRAERITDWPVADSVEP